MPQSIEHLQSVMRGEVIQPADAAYDSARKVYNGMIDKRPQLIARCVDVADVIAAVQFGRDNQMLTAIRGGGHNGAGLGTCDGGLVIDLSRMKGIRVDPGGAHRPRRGGMRMGRRRPRHPCLRHGRALRLHLHHRRCRPHPGRRHRLPRAPATA